jgi:hypothetical protein
LNDPLPASPSDAMLYSYLVFGCRDIREVLCTRSKGEVVAEPIEGRKVTSSPCTSQAILAVLPVTPTTNGPPASLSAPAISCAVVARAEIAVIMNKSFRMTQQFKVLPCKAPEGCDR